MISTRFVVVVSLFASLAIGIAKFIAWGLTGNASMLSQAYYSLSDVANQVLLLIGFRLSEKGASRKHPFGRGKEQYFFAFVVTVLLFGVTGYAAIREGYEVYGTAALEVDVTVNYVVLGIALMFEGYAFVQSYRALRQEADEQKFGSLVSTVRFTKDAPLLTAATENFVAVLGVLAAILGVYLTDVTGNTTYDAAASAFIGLLLMGFAVICALENRSLLVGEGVTRNERARLFEALSNVEGINEIVDLRTMHMGPDRVLVACEINFRDDLDTDGVERAIDRVETIIRKSLPAARRIYVEAESL